MIDVQNLIFEYPGLRALDDISFQIQANSVTALVGPNGAGKTTLMRCLCGLETPVSGDIVIDAIDVVEQPRRSRERIRYLSDFFGLYDELTIRQCLRYAALANRASGNIINATKRVAEGLRLETRLDQKVGELSRGLRQRVAIGQAIIHEPKVLILDEPASGLDPEARHDLAELFKQLQNAGMTLLVSSHILAELEAYATDMLVIRDGLIIEQRSLKVRTSAMHQIAIDVISDPAIVIAFLNARPEVQNLAAQQNRIVCEVDGGDRQQQLLLTELIASGAHIVNFATLERDLQQSYLDSIKETTAP
jgi:ABC-2 type transport system ATP-binding protein